MKTRRIYVNHPEFDDVIGSEKGYTVESFSIWEGYRAIAKLKVAYISQESWDEKHPTIYHFAVTSGGWCGRVENMNNLRGIYNEVKKYLHHHNEIAPINPTPEEIKEIFKAFERGPRYQQLLSELEFIKNYALNKPYVDYSEVHPEYRRQGLATRLYKYAAQYYAQKSMLLRASDIQSEEAQSLWASFKRKGWTKEVEIEDNGLLPSTFLALDPTKFANVPHT